MSFFGDLYFQVFTVMSLICFLMYAVNKALMLLMGHDDQRRNEQKQNVIDIKTVAENKSLRSAAQKWILAEEALTQDDVKNYIKLKAEALDQTRAALFVGNRR